MSEFIPNPYFFFFPDEKALLLLMVSLILLQSWEMKIILLTSFVANTRLFWIQTDSEAIHNFIW